MRKQKRSLSRSQTNNKCRDLVLISLDCKCWNGCTHACPYRTADRTPYNCSVDTEIHVNENVFSMITWPFGPAFNRIRGARAVCYIPSINLRHDVCFLGNLFYLRKTIFVVMMECFVVLPRKGGVGHHSNWTTNKYHLQQMEFHNPATNFLKIITRIMKQWCNILRRVVTC